MKINRRRQEFIRHPGLFRQWEIEDLMSVNYDLRIEPSGRTADGTPVYVVFRRLNVESSRDLTHR
jgi:hypothetical protein